MPRKSSKSTAQTAEQGVDLIMSTEPLKTVSEAAEFVGVAEIRVQELFCEALNLPEAMGWEVIPQEHEHLLNAFKAQINEIQALPEPPAVEPEPPLQDPEVSMLIEEPEVPKAKKSKSSALTKKKTEAVAKGRKAAKETQTGIKATVARLQAQEGIQDAANAGTVYLQAFQATLGNVKGQGLTVLAAEMMQGLSGEAGFTPDEILSELGVALSDETQAALMEQLAPALGKSMEATQEILDTSLWNGIDLQAELSQLDSLMNSEG